ncbi:DNA repair protein [Bdellovibrio sp. qaytius]|nr:DNA repair protein [Bdellovibrio sp. qaytius]
MVRTSILKTNVKSHYVIDSAEKVFQLLNPNYNAYAEEFWGVYLTHQMELIKMSMVHKGTLNSCKIHPRDLFREAVHANAFALIIAHNHTSQNVEPSLEDIRITKKLLKCAKLLEIPILDHVIYTKEKYFSFGEAKLF